MLEIALMRGDVVAGEGVVGPAGQQQDAMPAGIAGRRQRQRQRVFGGVAAQRLEREVVRVAAIDPLRNRSRTSCPCSSTPRRADGRSAPVTSRWNGSGTGFNPSFG